MDQVIRIVSSILVLLFELIHLHSLADGSHFLVHSIRNKALYGCSFRNISGATMGVCLQSCLSECRCMSFQICNETECQLCSSNQHLAEAALREEKDCIFYDLDMNKEEESEVDNQHCGMPCKRAINCCMTSQPCLNSGTCVPTFGKVTKMRFRCECPVGYQGDRCEHQITSCRGYASGSRISGTYKVFQANTTILYDVYCDFDNASSMTWTLLQSYKMENWKDFQHSLAINHSLANDNPGSDSWASYRLSKSRMESILRNSSKWRITCSSEPNDGRISTDHIQGFINNVNIMEETFEGCFEVEHARVGEQHCDNCTVFLKQTVSIALHSVYFHPPSQNMCEFKPTEIAHCKQDPTKNDHYFGNYVCTNPVHQCSKSAHITQTWFGG